MSQSPTNLNIFRTYLLRLSQFSRNARLFLLSAMITGAAFGVYRLLFNFYALSLGFDQKIIGNIITLNSLTALLVALPMGYLSDILGRKWSFILGGGTLSLSIAIIVFFPTELVFYATSLLIGTSQSLMGVTMAPFMIENSGVAERTYLFSLSQGLQMISAFIGSTIGGYLPSWTAQYQGVEPTSSAAYAGALSFVALVSALGLLPFFFLRNPNLAKTERSLFAPIGYAWKNRDSIGKLVLPMLVTSIGAGLFMPFMNIFFRIQYGASDALIGNILGWGALAMSIGLFIAPPIADRIGKIQLVVITQALSIPFLALLGFAPTLWMSALAHYFRLALMNMGGPIYSAFVMEHVEDKARAMVASLTSMAWNFGWAFSPSISGWLQVNYGFAPVYACVIVIYSFSVFLYWKFFWKSE
jgi:MFS family permease